MKHGSFDATTCRELVGDERARKIEAEARALAEAGLSLPDRPPPAGSYWSQVQEEAERQVALEAYEKRRARIARKAQHSGELPSQP